MSTTIDNRVVQMQFDNKQFEKNVATSMSTLDKLKQKLDFKGVSKGLDDVNSAAKKTDMSGLAKGVDAVHAKFSALQVMGVTALANITNSAVNAGKKMVSALTIDPIKTGFQEYETQINSVQTILSNTRDAGKNINDVNTALDELNKYADQTIYNFTEMTRNIGTFTAAGVDLDTSVNSIKGIANLAAVSGSTSQQASTAMYQLSQALASGTVKLMDWNSVVNAGMGGKVFQNALMETARVHGIAIDEMVEDQGSFRETLSEGWLTSDILTETLEKFTATTEGLTEAQLEQAKAAWLAKGYTEEQVEAIFALGEDATNAATKVKTFTQLWDVLKESAQSGWSQTWKLIIGDFEEAKSLLTPLAELMTGFINKISEARNKLLDSALGMGFGKLQKTLTKAFKPIEKVAKQTDKITSSLEDLGTVVDDVILGKFGDGEKRFEKLTESGYNYYKVQNKVNETLGNSYRHSDKLVEKQEKLLGTQKKTSEQTKDTVKQTNKLSKVQKEQLKKMVKMTEEQAKANGYTEEQIAALKELNKVANQLGMPLDELIDHLDEINGRWILINSFKNIGEALGKVFSSIGSAFRDVFDPIKPEQLFNAITALHRFTENLIISDNAAENLRNTFKGVFAIIDILTSILGGGFKLALTVISSVCEGFGTSILEVTGYIGNLIYKFNEWLDKHNPIVAFIENIAEKIPTIVEGVKNFISELYIDSGVAENFQKIAEGMKSIWSVVHGKFTLSLNSGIKVLTSVLALFGTNLANVLAFISDYIVKAVDWIAKNTMLIGSVDKIANILHKLITGIAECVKAFMALKPVQDVIESIKKAFSKLADIFTFDVKFEGSLLDNIITTLDTLFAKLNNLITGLDENEYFQAGLDTIKGLALGISSGVGKVIDAIVNIAKNIIDAFCGILGIESPSKVFIKLGSFIISGLALGLSGSYSEVFNAIKQLATNMVNIFNDVISDGVPKIYDTIKMVGGKLVDSFKEWDLDFGSLVIVGTIIGLMLLLKKLTDILEKVVNPLEKLGGLFDTLKSSIKDFTQAKVFETKTNAILNVAKAVALLAASFYLMAQLDWSEVGKGAVALIAVSGALALLTFIASKMDAIEIGKITSFMLGFSVSMLILSGAMRILSGIYVEDAITAIASLTVMAGAMAGLLYVFGKFVKNEATARQMGKAGAMFRKMAVAMLIMAVAVKVAASISKEDIGRGTAVIGGIALMFGMFMALTENSKHADKAGSLLLKMAIAMAIIPIVIKVIAGIDNADIFKGLAVIAGVELMFAAMVLITKSNGAYADKIGSMFLKMAAAMGILALTLKVIATMSYSDIKKGLICIAGIEALFLAFLVISGLAFDNGNKAGSMIFKMAAGMALMAVAIKLLGSIPVGEITKGLIVIAAIEALFAAMVLITTNTGPNAAQAGTMMLKMSAAILILAGAIVLLSILDPKDIAVATAAITTLMLSFAAIAFAVSKMKDCMNTLIVIASTIALLVGAVIALTFIDTERVIAASASISGILAMLALLTTATKFAGKVDKSLVIILGVIAGLGGILYLLSGMPVESTLSTAASLSILLLSISAALKIMDTISHVSTSAIGAMYALSGVVAILATVLGVLAYLDVAPSIESASAISVLMTAMSGALLLMSKVEHVSTSAIGAMYALSGVVAILATVLGVLAYLDVAPSIETATSLSILLLSMSAVTAILSAIGPVASSAIAGAGAFVAVVGILGTLMVGLGALMKYVPALEEFLDKGITVLEKIGQSIGAFFGGIVAGFAAGVVSTLPSIGEQLSAFMIKLKPFITGAKTVDDSVKTGVDIIAESVMALTKASLVKNLASFLTLGSSFARMGADLSTFIINAKPFIEHAKGFTPDMFKGVSSLADAILAITEANLVEGISRFLPFSSSLTKFGSQLPALGTSLKNFVSNLGTFSDDQVSTVKCAAKAMVELSKAASNIDGQANWAKKLFGDNSLSAFADQLAPTANALRRFISNIGTFSDDQIETVKCAANAIVELSKAASKVDGQSNWAKKLFGDNSLSAFADQLAPTAKALKGFVTNLGTFTDEQVSTVKCAANAVKAMANASSNIDGQANWAKKLFGDNGLGAFSKDLPGVASNLKGFVKNLGTFNDDKIATVNSAVGVVKALAKLGSVDTSSILTKLPNLGRQMVTFGENLKKFCSKVGGIDSSEVSNTTTAIVKVIKNLPGKLTNYKSSLKRSSAALGQAIADGLNSKKSTVTSASKALSKAAKSGISNFQSDFKSTGKKLGKAMVDGLNAKKSDAKSAGKALGKRGKSGVLEYKDDFKQAGKDLGNGLINGIKAKKKAAYNAGYALGAKSAQGVKDGSKEKSPSKLTYQYGIWQGEGLINGINVMGKKAYKAGFNLGDTAAKSMSDAISKISSAIDTDMDTQPTIRPVLDLDDVRSGARSIGGMFSDATVGVSTNANSITRMMNERNQNGNNDDVVSAIDKLRKGISNMSNTTYNINGVTSNNSDVADAIAVIARAAMVERRV